jgi:hypothetical protein
MIASDNAQTLHPCSRNVCLVRPACFGYNPQTAATNAFQSADGAGAAATSAVAEFDALVKKHMRLDAAHGSQGTDVQGFGQPEPLILWMPFAYAVQKMADGGKYDIQLRGKLSAEQQALYDKNQAAIKAFEAQTASDSRFDVGGFIQSSNTTAALEGMRRLEVMRSHEELITQEIGRASCRERVFNPV